MRFSLAATELDRKKQQKEFNRKKQQKERARKTVPLAARNCNVAEPVEPEAVTACDAPEPLDEEVLKTVDEPAAEEKAQEVRLVDSGDSYNCSLGLQEGCADSEKLAAEGEVSLV